MTVESTNTTNATSSALMQEIYDVEFDNYEESEKLTFFLDTIKEQFDDKIGQPTFRPNFKAIFKGVEIEDWKKKGDGLYCLTLSSAYEAAKVDRSGKTFIFEKDILMQFDPENLRIIFPKVVEYKDAGKVIDKNAIAEKGLNAIWAQEIHAYSLYTGVGYQTVWDSNEKKFVSDNINDAGWLLQKLATPHRKTVKKSVTEWNERNRVKI